MSQWHAHSRSVVFHTLYRGGRDTKLCPYLVHYTTLHPLPVPQIGSLPFYPLLYSSIPYSSTSAAVSVVSLSPVISIPACSYHHITTRAPCILSVALHRSRSDLVAMYCATVLCLCQMYASIVSNLASALAASAEVYSQFPSARRRGNHPINCHAN